MAGLELCIGCSMYDPWLVSTQQRTCVVYGHAISILEYSPGISAIAAVTVVGPLAVGSAASAGSGVLPSLPVPLHCSQRCTDSRNRLGTTPRPSQATHMGLYAGGGGFAISLK